MMPGILNIAILSLAKKLTTDSFESVVEQAKEIVKRTNKTPERALADAVHTYLNNKSSK